MLHNTTQELAFHGRSWLSLQPISTRLTRTWPPKRLWDDDSAKMCSSMNRASCHPVTVHSVAERLLQQALGSAALLPICNILRSCSKVPVRRDHPSRRYNLTCLSPDKAIRKDANEVKASASRCFPVGSCKDALDAHLDVFVRHQVHSRETSSQHCLRVELHI